MKEYELVGGQPVRISPLTVTENETIYAGPGSAFNPVITNVPNSYSASDNGKVVQNGALVAQTAHADVIPATIDQTIDTTLNNSVKVKGDANLVAGNIKDGVSIFGVTGDYSGGGNPNYVETITGTLANPWGEKTPANLFSGAKSGNLTMMMDIDATAIGGTTFHVIFYPFGIVNGFGLFIAASQLSNSIGVYAEYKDSGVMEVAYGLQNGSILDYSSYASTISTTLTIIHHPIPEDNT